ncbi:hypothetical protein ACFE04_003814 [Oxalis oulophora]
MVDDFLDPFGSDRWHVRCIQCSTRDPMTRRLESCRKLSFSGGGGGGGSKSTSPKSNIASQGLIASQSHRSKPQCSIVHQLLFSMGKHTIVNGIFFLEPYCLRMQEYYLAHICLVSEMLLCPSHECKCGDMEGLVKLHNRTTKLPSAK